MPAVNTLDFPMSEQNHMRHQLTFGFARGQQIASFGRDGPVDPLYYKNIVDQSEINTPLVPAASSTITVCAHSLAFCTREELKHASTKSKKATERSYIS